MVIKYYPLKMLLMLHFLVFILIVSNLILPYLFFLLVTGFLNWLAVIIVAVLLIIVAIVVFTKHSTCVSVHLLKQLKLPQELKYQELENSGEKVQLLWFPSFNW